MISRILRLVTGILMLILIFPLIITHLLLWIICDVNLIEKLVLYVFGGDKIEF